MAGGVLSVMVAGFMLGSGLDVEPDPPPPPPPPPPEYDPGVEGEVSVGVSVNEGVSAVEIVSGLPSSAFGLVFELAGTRWVSVAVKTETSCVSVQELPDESVANHETQEVPNGKPTKGQ